MAALMTSVMLSTDKVPAYINICLRRGVDSASLCNASHGVSGAKDGKITFDMNAIKSLSKIHYKGDTKGAK